MRFTYFSDEHSISHVKTILFCSAFFLNNQGNLSKQSNHLLFVFTFCKFDACLRFFILLGSHVKGHELIVFISCTDIAKYHLGSDLKQWAHVDSQGELKPWMIIS